MVGADTEQFVLQKAEPLAHVITGYRMKLDYPGRSSQQLARLVQTASGTFSLPTSWTTPPCAIARSWSVVSSISSGSRAHTALYARYGRRIGIADFRRHNQRTDAGRHACFEPSARIGLEQHFQGRSERALREILPE